MEQVIGQHVDPQSPPPLRHRLPRIVLVGRPGAGKGTQGSRLVAELGVQYLSTGDLLRGEIEARTALGREVERAVHSGELISTTLIVAIVEACLRGDGYVLDGFPRTVEQAVAMMSRSRLMPDMAIEIVVPEATALARLTARCRTDDNYEVARRRMTVYEAETTPMLSYFTGHGLLRHVNGDDPPDSVAANIIHHVRRLTAEEWHGQHSVERVA